MCTTRLAVRLVNILNVSFSAECWKYRRTSKLKWTYKHKPQYKNDEMAHPKVSSKKAELMLRETLMELFVVADKL